MKAKGNVAREEEFFPLFPEWEEVKEWAKKTFSEERVALAAIGGTTVIILGVLLYALHKAMLSYTVVGF